MNPVMPIHLAERYKSQAQRARVVSEAWGERNLFCPRCPSPRLHLLSSNAPAADFSCPSCLSSFQLKSQSRPISGRVVDAAYGAMVEALRRGATPNLFVLYYDRAQWVARDLLLVPEFALSLSCIEKRPPLGPGARRSGRVGCNILLANIPADAKISLLASGSAADPRWVRRRYAQLRPLEREGHEARGRALDVLRVIREMNRARFTLDEVYSHERELAKLHPSNRNVKPKIRQQLQKLRDLGLVEFLGRGAYWLR